MHMHSQTYRHLSGYLTLGHWISWERERHEMWSGI